MSKPRVVWQEFLVSVGQIIYSLPVPRSYGSFCFDFFFDRAHEISEVFHSFITEVTAFTETLPSSSSFAPTTNMYKYYL